MPSVAEYQKKYNEISEIQQATKIDYSISNAKKRQRAEEYTVCMDYITYSIQNDEY